MFFHQIMPEENKYFCKSLNKKKAKKNGRKIAKIRKIIINTLEILLKNVNEIAKC